MKRGSYAGLSVFCLAAGLLLFFYVYARPTSSGPPSSSEPQRTSSSASAVTADRDAFGIATAGLRVQHGRVQQGETFAELLTDHGVSYEKMLALAEAARPAFEVQHLKAGTPYRYYEARGSGAPRYLVYRRDAVHYVTFDLTGTPRVWTGVREVDVQRKHVSGVVEHSLYAALDEAGAPAKLAYKLSRAFAWQVNFFHLQPGDRFEIIYQQRRVAGEPVGPGKILAARFEHRGETFYGFYLPAQDGYFNRAGESLHRSLLQAPLQYTRITSPYTKRRFHPILERWTAHLGTDYAAPPGTPVYSVGGGTVLVAGYDRYNGNWVKIRHSATYTTGYLHLSDIGEGIEPGATVEQGEIVGYVGSTGLATGPHLCYRFWKNGRQVDPYEQELPPSEPVASDNRLAFYQVKADLMPLIRPASADVLLASGTTRPAAAPLLFQPLVPTR